MRRRRRWAAMTSVWKGHLFEKGIGPDPSPQAQMSGLTLPYLSIPGVEGRLLVASGSSSESWAPSGRPRAPDPMPAIGNALVVVEPVRLARVEPLLPGTFPTYDFIGFHGRRNQFENCEMKVLGIALPK